MIRAGIVRSSRLFSTIPAGSYLPQQEVVERVTTVVQNLRKFENVKPNAHFITDLKLDSLLRKSLYNNLADEFRVVVPAEVSEKMLSVDDAVKFFASHPKAR